MADDGSTISIDLDPKKVIQSVNDIQDSVKELSTKMEEALGKQAPKSFEKMETAAEEGTNKIQGFFRNLGTRVKEDLKTAFDIGSIAGGLKVGQLFNQGIKEVLDMERAFDRLNVRLKMTGKEFQSFKDTVGKKVSATGTKLEDVMPGIETVAAKGGVKNGDHLSAIGEMLGQVKATTGESTEGVASAVVQILKDQGKSVTAESFKATLDALEATRTNGAFKSVGEAGNAVQGISGYGNKLGLNTRQLGGLAAVASQSGAGGQKILEQLAQTATDPLSAGRQRLGAGLGVNLFKNGKFDPAALANVDTKKFSGMSGQIVEQMTGLKGSNGEDLKRFIESFKSNMSSFKAVTNGANETANDFQQATDNLASKIDQFKEKAVNAGRQVGDSVSNLLNDVLGGKTDKLGSDVKGVGGAIGDNAGVVAGAGAVAVVGALMAGGGVRGLMGMAKGAVGAQVAKAEGVQPVYVTNASEIGGGGMPGVGGGAGSGAMGKLAGGLAAAGIGIAIGEVLLKMFPKLGSAGGEGLYDMIHGKDAEDKATATQDEKNRQSFNDRNGTQLSPEEYAKAVHDGTLKAMKAAKGSEKVQYTNPSAVNGRGKAM